MTKQAQVGLFAALAILLLFGVFYVITDYGTRHSGYRMGVHFQSAAGLQSGSLVFFSGVTVGTVDSIVLLPDNTIDVTMAIGQDVDVPRGSKFLIQAPLTGSPNLLIVPPKPGMFPLPTPSPWERQVLPVADQPVGENTATIADLLEQGQGEVKRLDEMLNDLQKREPKLLDTLQRTLESANSLTNTANNAVGQLAAQAQLASANVVALTTSLNRTVNGNTGRVNNILAQLDAMSVSLLKSTQSLQSLATNKDVKDSIIATTKSIAETTATIADITKDLHNVTGSPQTQAQLRDTVSNLDATMQRANSLLGNFGGKSCVSGVDDGCTPIVTAPDVNGSPFPLATMAPPFPNASPGTAAALRVPGSRDASTSRAKNAVGDLLKNLVSIQLRLSVLNRETNTGAPLLSRDRGPSTDVNLLFLPVGGTSVVLGASDLGGPHPTANAYVLESVGRRVRMGAGILYSRLGFIGQYNAKAFGIEGRLYDPRHPSLDLYGDLRVTHGLKLFFGQRDILHTTRRNTYGLQMQF